MDKAIKNKLVGVYWLPWAWKSIFAMFLSTFYERIISNLDVTYNWKSIIQKRICTMEDLHGIEFSTTKGLAILDEWGINITSRRSMSSANLDFLELWMLSRKKNMDIIVISQLERSLDVVIRELCTYSFHVNSYFIKKDYLIFEIEIYNRFWKLIKSVKADLIKFIEKYNFNYNTKEDSKINRTFI